MKILANDGISNETKLELENNGYVVLTDNVKQDDLITYINDNNIEILLVRSATTVRKDLIDSCENLKLIGRGGVGMDNIDVQYARDNGKIVINTPGASSQSVAELVFGQMFAISRNIYNSSESMKNGNFNNLKKHFSKGVELRGKTLGIIGFGRIGQTLASYALAIGMDVLAIDIEEKSVDVKLTINNNTINVPVDVKTNIDDILPLCDYISLHVPKQSNGNSVINEREFNMMKNGVRIINASRGGVINENDLINALDSNKVSFASLDVFENEPNPDTKLLKHDKISSTPHIGAATLEAQDRIGNELVEQILSHFGILV